MALVMIEHGATAPALLEHWLSAADLGGLVVLSVDFGAIGHKIGSVRGAGDGEGASLVSTYPWLHVNFAETAPSLTNSEFAAVHGTKRIRSAEYILTRDK
jgi:hypothetical protein